MPSYKKHSSGDRRKDHNLDLIRRMRSGEPLNAIDSKASWYPPRPIIKKDPLDMARLYPQMTPVDGPAPAAKTARPNNLTIAFKN